MNEWEFTAEVAGWINEILSKNPGLRFSGAKCEQTGESSLKRRDLTLLDSDQRIVLTGEVKLPYNKDGSSPHNATVVSDARAKAQRAGARFFFTWNVNEFVLWETDPSKTSWQEQNYKSWTVTSAHKESHLDQPSTTYALRTWLARFLNEFAQILHGIAQIGWKSPDEKFIGALESFLRVPIQLSLEKLHELYQKPKPKSEINKWMREEQGWVISDDAEAVRDNLERAAKFACYALVNKLVFHEALLKRYGQTMSKLNVPEHVDSGEKLRLHLEAYFAEAKSATGDYETVFGEDHTSIGNRIPFYSDNAVTHWRELIEQIHKFDFSKLDYEVIGNMFERLIAPEERSKFGQFYTRVEVVDLINSFCIRYGDEKVMDPACGGGTFLVRAYARKRELDPGRKHGQLLSDLYGVDVSHFATHLTTINLATRDLIDMENYPQIARSDFFDIESGNTFVTLPTHVKARGLGKMQHRDLKIPSLDAAIGNPPYVEQGSIPVAKKKGKQGVQHGTKEYYLSLVKKEGGAKLSGRSDIHCYFWPHATSFLKEHGYLGFLTSSQWLDVEYGFRLQEWILNNFEITAIFESIDEPWFVGARVVTAVTVLRRQVQESKRNNNTVRFVQLRKPISEILSHDGTTAGAVSAANHFRDEILKLGKDTVNERYRARLVRQGNLWKRGVKLGVTMGKSEQVEAQDEEVQYGKYYGGKWGVYLRAPDLWFELLDHYGAKFSPLSDVANIRRGITSGADDFFFTKDHSSACLASHPEASDFEAAYGVPRKDVESGKVKLVRCGEGHGEIRPIEAEYLEPEVHSLMEIGGFTVSPGDCARLILLVGKRKEELQGTYALEYIKWGEKQDFHKGSTCAARVTESRQWYDLTGHNRGKLFWPKSQQYKHAIPINDNNLQANCNLYDVHAENGIDPNVMAGILNCTLTVLSKFQYGRPVGVEGNLKTEVVDVKMMLVPDPTRATAKAQQRVAEAFEKLKQRKALQFLSERRMRQMAYTAAGKEAELDKLSDKCELDMPDRRELDDAVLEMIGVGSKPRRDKLNDELYAFLRQFFELTRQKEEKAIVNKNTSRRRSAMRPSEIAAQIYRDIAEDERESLHQYDADYLDKSNPFDTFDLPVEGTAAAYSDLFVAQGVKFVKGKNTQVAMIQTGNPIQSDLIVTLASSGIRGLVRIPHEEDECRKVFQRYDKFLKERDKRIRQLIEERTADEEMQEKIYQALMPLVLQSSTV